MARIAGNSVVYVYDLPAVPDRSVCDGARNHAAPVFEYRGRKIQEAPENSAKSPALVRPGFDCFDIGTVSGPCRAVDYRTVTQVQGASWFTLCETLPSKRPSISLNPRHPMTIMSISCSLA